MRGMHRLGLLVVGVLVPVAAGAQPGTEGAAPEVTFAKDIAPILQRSCQECHRPDSVAPMSLLTYEEVRPWARAIKARTALRNKRGAMPPWFIEKDIGDPALQERPVAQRGGDRGHRDLGRQRGARSATRPISRRRASSPGRTSGRSASPT